MCVPNKSSLGALGPSNTRTQLNCRTQLSEGISLYEYNSSPAIGAAAIKFDDHARKLLLLLDLKRKVSIS